MKNPLIASQIDPISGKIINAIVFIGSVPDDIVAAVKRATGSFSNLNWSAKDQKKLASYYGTSWRKMLTPEMINFTADSIIGGASAFDDLGAIASSRSRKPISRAEKKETGLPYFSLIDIYPEDTIYDVKMKIQTEGFTPYMRQHFYYYLNGDGPKYPYSVSFGTNAVIPNWKSLDSKEPPIISGISINVEQEASKDDMKVEIYDKAQLVSQSEGIKISHVFFIDLFSIVKKTNVDTIIRDEYKLSLLFYGALISYFPQITNITELKQILMGEDHIDDPQVLRKRYNEEKKIANRALTYASKNDRVSISEATVKSESKSRIIINVRNALDELKTEGKLIAIRAIIEDYVIVKRNAFSYRPRAAEAYRLFSKMPPILNTIDFLVIRSELSEDCSQGITYDFIRIVINSNGDLYVSGKWPSDQNVDFDDIESKLFLHAIPVIEKINALGPSGLPLGGKIAVPKSNGKIAGSSVSRLTASTYWPRAVTVAGFDGIKKRFRELEIAGIIIIKGLQQTGVFTFYFQKGVTCVPFCESWIGRHVKLHHRATDIRLEIINANSRNEFEIIKRYIFSFLNHVAPSQSRAAIKEMSADNTLKRLHERDPVLFDLKKYDQNASVYSVICQANRQPLIYNEDEKKMLTLEEQSKLTKYNNYTKNEPAYYGCPNPEYPFLNLKSGIHPMGYDIPCCKKFPSVSNNAAQSKHILTYGKDIPIGRFSHPPRELKDELLLGIKKEYRLVGVSQSAPSIPYAGFAFSLIYLLPKNAMITMAEQVKLSHDTYHILGNGTANVFESAEELANDIIISFVKKDVCFTKFSPGEVASGIWIDIFIDLVREVFDIEIIILDDEENNGSIVLKAASIRNTSIIIIIKNSNGYYPLIELDGDVQNLIFDPNTKINKYIMSVLKGRRTNRLNFPDYSNILAFEERNKMGLKIKKFLIDKQNQCYAIILINPKGELIHFPVLSSPVPKDPRNIYGIYEEGNYPKEVLLDCITEFNRVNNSRVNVNFLLKFDDMFVGFDAEVGKSKFRFYHNKSEAPIVNDKLVVPLAYDPRGVDREMYSPKQNKISQLVIDSANKHVLYGRLQAELAYVLRAEMNTPLREEISAILKLTNFKDVKSMSLMRRKLIAKLSQYVEDLRDILKIISRSIEATPKQIIDYISGSVFSFDKISLEKLRNEPKLANTIKGLHKLLDKRVIPFDGTFATMPKNTYAPCSVGDDTCSGDGKLRIPKDIYDHYFEILAVDVRSIDKAYILTTADSRVAINLKFEIKPCEYITRTKYEGSQFNPTSIF